jgi:outer membrane protein insertion porin family
VKKKRFFQVLMLAVLATSTVKGEEGFIVEDIQVRGLQRISAGTVYNYLPVNVGENFSMQKVGPSIRALFKTGFFKDISLEREGGILIVNVVERPSIAKIIFEGNKDISTEDLEKALNAIGLDRLLMIMTGSRVIDEVLAFPVSRV